MTAGRITAIVIDPVTLAPAHLEADRERQVASHDLIDANHIEISGAQGPFTLTLSQHETRLHLAFTTAAGPAAAVDLAILPLRRQVKDYFLVCETYYASVRSAPAARLEALDTERRAAHDAAARDLAGKLAPAVVADFATSRALFTLISTLFWKK